MVGEDALRIVVGTTNPTKIAGVRNAFKEVFPRERVDIVSIKVSNRVGTQPIGLDSILVGALNRVKNCMASERGADFYVGVEAGIATVGAAWIDVHIAVVTDGEIVGIGMSPGFMVPPQLAKKVVYSDNLELDVVADEVFGTKDIGSAGGIVKILTRGLISREDLVKYAVLTALIPWMKRDLYPRESLRILYESLASRG